MKALSTLELDKILKSNSGTKSTFLGTFPSCVYPDTTRTRYSFISNTDNHNAPGVHWIGWFVNNSTVTFFDSFARSPFSDTFPEQYIDFMDRFKSVIFSNLPVQAHGTVSCGYFCIHFIYMLSLGLNIDDFLDEYYDCNDTDIVTFNFVKSIT